MTKSVVTGLFGAALVTAGVLGAGVGSADPAPAAPGYCGGDPLDSYDNSAPPTPASSSS